MVVVDYVPDGLRCFGMLVKKYKEDNNWSYLDAARSVGFGSANTVLAWVRNIDNPVTEPSLKNLNILAPHLMNPLSGKAFTGEELLQVCQGKLLLTEAQIAGCSFRVDSQGYPVEQRPPLKTAESVETLHRVQTLPRNQFDSIQAVQLGHHYVEMANQYWYSTIEPGIELMLDHVGDRLEDGSVSFASKEYVYEKDPHGVIEVKPKDGRPPLLPETMNNRDWQVMKALSQKAVQKYGQLPQQGRSQAPKIHSKVS